MRYSVVELLSLSAAKADWNGGRRDLCLKLDRNNVDKGPTGMFVDLKLVEVESTMGPREIVEACKMAVQKGFVEQDQLVTNAQVDHLDHLDYLDHLD